MTSAACAQLSSSLSSKFKATSQKNEEWKCSLRFTGDNPLFPVEMFLKIIEEESNKRGLDDNDKVLEVLSRVPDHPQNCPDSETNETKSVSEGKGSPASSWKRRLLEKQRKKQQENIFSKESDPNPSKTGGLNWQELKRDMLSEFGRPPNQSYSTIEKLNFVQSLCKGKGESSSIFLLRVLIVANILEKNKPIENYQNSSNTLSHNNYSEHAHCSKRADIVKGSSNNFIPSSNHQQHHQSSQFSPIVATSSLTNYNNPYSAVVEPILPSSRQQYENWLTEQRRLGRGTEPAQSYQPNNLKSTNEHNLHHVTDYSMSSSSSISNPNMGIREQPLTPMNTSHSNERTENIGGQIDGQYDETSDFFQSEKNNIWVRMLFMLGLSRRERNHLLQLGGDIDHKSVNDICSYLTKQNDLHIKQELVSSSDEYDDESDEEVFIPNKKYSIDGNHDINDEDNYDYQQTLELEMEEGQSGPSAIKVKHF